MAKLIFVPEFHPTVVTMMASQPRMYPVIPNPAGGVLYGNVNYSGANANNSYYSSIGQVTVPIAEPVMTPGINPVDVEMAWRWPYQSHTDEKSSRSSRSISMTDKAIHEKVWQRQDMADWIEANCQADCVVQGFTCSGSGWLFVFVCQDDAVKFQAWCDLTSLPPFIIVPNDYDRWESLRDWMRDETKDVCQIYRFTDEVRVRFRSEIDRVHFMLRWAGAEHEAAA